MGMEVQNFDLMLAPNIDPRCQTTIDSHFAETYEAATLLRSTATTFLMYNNFKSAREPMLAPAINTAKATNRTSVRAPRTRQEFSFVCSFEDRPRYSESVP
jgi:hypothetical protein